MSAAVQVSSTGGRSGFGGIVPASTKRCKQPKAALSQAVALEMADLRRQVELVKEQRNDVEVELQASRDAQRELRNTVDVLRSKLHSQGQREVRAHVAPERSAEGFCGCTCIHGSWQDSGSSACL